ncbi:helix-turn-helix domain-containing protein [Brevibacillus formosus]
MQLFVQKGFGSTNVQDIADTAGISIGLMYRHYKSKETLTNWWITLLQACRKTLVFSRRLFHPNKHWINEVKNITQVHGQKLIGLE